MAAAKLRRWIEDLPEARGTAREEPVSALFGVFNLDGRPVAPESFEGMRESSSAWRVDGSGEWSEGAIHLGQQIFHGTPESALERYPLTGVSGQVMLIASLRLDNRDQLCRQLNVPAREAAAQTDGALLLKAYDKWGRDCAAHLLGDWVFALWDCRRRSLLLGRDYIGSASLYFYRDHRRFVFASSLPTLLACPDVPRRLNPLAIAQLSAEGKRDSATCYASVFAVPPAHTLTVTSDTTLHHRYWHPRDIAPVRHRTEQNYIDAFREIYAKAVQCRLRSLRPVGILLSGGLDSSSVAALAAPHLEAGGQELAAFTLIPRYQSPEGLTRDTQGDESRLVENIRAHVGNIDVTLVPTACGPLAGVRWALHELGQPSHVAASAFWMRPVLQAAARRDIGTLLTGDWGNTTISWSGERTRTLRRRVVQPFVELLRVWFLGRSSNPRSVVRGTAARPLIREQQPVASELEALRRRSPQPLQSIYNMSQSGSVSTTAELCAALPMEVRMPPLDQRVVEFCLGLPPECYARSGRTRLLVRDAMEGLLPPEVLWNERRGQIAADVGHWVQAEQSEIGAALQQLQASPLARHWLDLPSMIAGFEGLRSRIEPRTLSGFGATVRGLTIGLFLLSFEGE